MLCLEAEVRDFLQNFHNLNDNEHQEKSLGIGGEADGWSFVSLVSLLLLLLSVVWRTDDFEWFLVLQGITEADLVLGKYSDEVLGAFLQVLDLQPLDLRGNSDNDKTRLLSCPDYSTMKSPLEKLFPVYHTLIPQPFPGIRHFSKPCWGCGDPTSPSSPAPPSP